MSSKKNSDKETFSLPKTVSLFGTQKALVSCKMNAKGKNPDAFS